MTFRAIATLTLVVAACGGTNKSPGPAKNDLSGSGQDLSVATPTELYTSSACAAAPCTIGCTFSSTSAAGASSQIATKDVEACHGFCGLFGDAFFGGIRGCWHYDYGNPTCQECGYHAECYILDEPSVDYATGGAICPSDCGTPGPLADMGAECPDMATVD